MRTLLASLLVLAAGTLVLAASTHGLQAFTAETALRMAVEKHPRPVPEALLETAAGERFTLAELKGRWVLVEFIYTRCTSLCAIQGLEFAELQRELATMIDADELMLVSISFDLEQDDAAALAAYQQRSSGTKAGWRVSRPVDAASLAQLKQVFGLVVIPDELGEFQHNAAINIIDPAGRLISIVDWNAPQQARARIEQGRMQAGVQESPQAGLPQASQPQVSQP